jgi:hypothetical protein
MNSRIQIIAANPDLSIACRENPEMRRITALSSAWIMGIASFSRSMLVPQYGMTF